MAQVVRQRATRYLTGGPSWRKQTRSSSSSYKEDPARAAGHRRVTRLRRCRTFNGVRTASVARRADRPAPPTVSYFAKSGFDGEHTESNHRLIWTPAWASPQKWRVLGALAAVMFHLSAVSCVAPLDHEPVTRAAGDLSTDFAWELLRRAHHLAHSPSLHCDGALLQENFESKTARFNGA